MYTLLGTYPIIPAAELLDLQSAANRHGVGNARTGSIPQVIGKRPGLFALRDSSGISMVFALGSKSSDGWRVVDGSATYTPTNLSTWTVGGDSTYSNGLLTTDAGNDAAGRASQGVNLTAGTYRVSGTWACEGTIADGERPRLRIGTAAANADYGSFVGGLDFIHATAAESLDPKGQFSFNITVPADEVFFTLDVVDETGAVLQAGSAFITLNPLEAV